MDHALFTEELLEKATATILKTRDGLLRAAVPSPLGSCLFLNDVTQEEMGAALRRHKSLMKRFPREGAGIEAFVDASDTGYTVNETEHEKDGAKLTNGQAHVHGNGNGPAHAKMTSDVEGGMRNVFGKGVLNELKKSLPMATRIACAVEEEA
ncbi:hypothetical protein BDW67DRAFT_186653 [Aspergillus spinulosporus]